MAAKRGATFRRRELGKELRKLREAKNLTLGEVAKSLSFSQTKLNRVESAENDLPRVGDLEKLMDEYGVTVRGDRELLLQLHRESLSKEPWTPYRQYMPSKMPTFRGLESDATSMRAFEPGSVFGLFQTAAYARAQYTLAKPIEETTSAYVETNVRLRLERKELITRSENPLTLRVIMDEAAVRRMLAGRDVMREQYDEIIELNKLENVTVQILPNLVESYRPTSNFVILDFPDALDPVVQVDMPNTISVTDEAQDVALHIRRFDAVRESALAPSETAGFLQRLKDEWK
ncbi:helix-turn-helix domain-containing protein [Streptomyces sp. NPDC054865]